MGCAIFSLLLGMPRLALILLWVMRPGWLARAYDGLLWPLLGLLFLPWTTLAFAYGVNSLGPPGVMPPLGWLLTGIALLIDLGIIGGGAHRRRRCD